MAGTITAVNQLSTSGGALYQHEDCGLCCSLGEAVDAGLPHTDTIASMEQWYTKHGDCPVDGTGLDINVAWLQSRGLPAAKFFGGMDVVDGFMAQGFRVTLLIFSNHAGYPYSDAGCVGHFVEVCARNADGSYAVMQPVGGYVVNYSHPLLVANSQNMGIVVKHDYGQGAVTTVIGTTSGGVPVSFDPNKTRRALNDLVRYLSGMQPASSADLDWDDAHAASLGAGEEEFLMEGAVSGSDSSLDPQLHKGLTILHTLAQGKIPPELEPAIKALVSGG